ncbi:MAG: hypothetical protein AAGM21_09675 [Pseudomonadota bacterium]
MAAKLRDPTAPVEPSVKMLVRDRPEGDLRAILYVCAVSVLVHPAIVWGMGRALDLPPRRVPIGRTSGHRVFDGVRLGLARPFGVLSAPRRFFTAWLGPSPGVRSQPKSP